MFKASIWVILFSLVWLEHPHRSYVHASTSQTGAAMSCGMRNAAQSDANADVYGKEAISKRILGGKDAQANLWPWQAYLRYNNGGQSVRCSGVMLSPNLMITVAQCTPSKDPRKYIIVLGEHDVSRYEGMETLHNVKKVIVPRGFNRTTLAYDLALVILENRVSAHEKVGYICLPPPRYYVQPGSECYITGWGLKMTSQGLRMVQKLQELKTRVIPENACGQALGRRLPDINMCAGSANSTSGGCSYDRGSPLVCFDNANGRWILQGLLSYSPQPCDSNKTRYTIFTRMSVYSRAIQSMIKNYQQTIPSTRVSTTSVTNVSTTSQTSATFSTSSPTSLSTTEKSTRKLSTTPTSATTGIKTRYSSSSPSRKQTIISTGKPATTQRFTIRNPLRIQLRSEGCNDRDKSSRYGKAFVMVNGVDYSRHKNGHNIVIVDLKTGQIEKSVSFNTHNSLEFEGMKKFLANIKPRKIVLVSLQSEGSRYQVALHRELIRFGATSPFEFAPCSTYCLMGYSGPEVLDWTRQESHKPSFGPSVISEVVPTPSTNFIRIRMYSEVFTNKSSQKKADAYIWINGIDRSKHIDGYNIVVIDHDAGTIDQVFGISSNTSLPEIAKLVNKLNSLPNRKILAIVIQREISKHHWLIRKTLSKYGASSELELPRGTLYGFIGYTGPEKVLWTAETYNKHQGSPIDLKVYVKKGYKTCGLSSLPPPSRKLFKYVVGGAESSQGLWPWMAAIIDGNHKLICGAALIADKWLVTAAHCVQEMKARPSPCKILLGSLEYSIDAAAERLVIAESHIHPKFNSSTYDYDIAVVKTLESVKMRQDIRTICIGKKKSFNKDQRTCYVSGWGRLRQNGAYPDSLVHAKVPIVGSHICNNTKLYKGRITDRMFCAGYQQGGIDSCHGDSGGPLSCQDSDGYWHLVGIVSWGIGCAKPDQYGVYADVDKFSDWIFKTIWSSK